MATVHSTNDVSLEILERFAADLQPDLLVEIDSSQTFSKSAQPPSWITLLAGAEWWMQVISAYGAVYTVEIVKEAAKESWNNRGQAVDALKSIGGGVKTLARSISELRSRLSSSTMVRLGIPLPDDHFGTTLDLVGSDSEHVEQVILMFVAHLPKISDIISAQRLTGKRVLAGMRLRLLDNGALEVSWSEYSETGGFSQAREVLTL